MASSLLLWQLADSAFPTGGFVHSSGLEAAFRLGEVDGSAAVERFLGQSIDQAGHGALPLVTAVHHAPERLLELDQLCEASMTHHVSNRASRAQGQAWLTTAAATFATPELRALKGEARRRGFVGHLAPVFGAVSAMVGLARAEAQRLFLFLHLRGLVSTAVRLNLVGPMAAQAMQLRLSPAIESTWERCRDLEPADLTQTAPLLELFGGHHERLYSRLFSS